MPLGRPPLDKKPTTRIQAVVTQDQLAWLRKEAKRRTGERTVSMSEIIRDLIDQARGEE